MPEGDDAMAELRAALSGAPGTRSSLHQWMRANHDKVSALLAEVRPNWQRLAGAFARMGLTDGSGKPPRPQTVRQTWWRVRRAVATAKSAPGAEMRNLPVTSDASDALARLTAEMNERSGRKR
jgi:hypothetical protein